MERLVHVISNLYPKAARFEIEQTLRYAGSDAYPRTWMAKKTIMAFFAAIVFAFVFRYLTNNIEAIIIGFLTFGAYLLVNYLLIFYKMEQRSKSVEAIMPAYLQFLAANLNSGLTPFQAVKASSKEEFGVLHEEIDRAVGLSLGVKPFKEALLEIPNRVHSTAFRKFITLFVDGMRTGGSLSHLLEELSQDIVENMDLKREITTQSKSYIMFIGFTVLAGAPLLSAVSIHFLRTIAMVRDQANVDAQLAPGMAGMLGEMLLTPDFLKIVITFNILATSTIASYLIAVIREGKDKYLFKYAIFMIPIALSFFLVLDKFFQNML